MTQTPAKMSSTDLMLGRALWPSMAHCFYSVCWLLQCTRACRPAKPTAKTATLCICCWAKKVHTWLGAPGRR